MPAFHAPASCCCAGLACLLRPRLDNLEFFSCNSTDAANLPDALATFRGRGADLVRKAVGTANGDAMWAAACEVVEGLLLGVQKQLDHVRVHVEVKGCSGEAVASGEEALVLTVEFSPSPLVGEFATRSRIGGHLTLERCLRFALEQPCRGSDVAPIVVRVRGVAIDPLPEGGMVRRYMQEMLGRPLEASDREACYELWEEHKQEVCPCESSKFRWVIESLLSNPFVAPFLSRYEKATCFWGFMVACRGEFASWEFWNEGRAGVRMTARNKQPDPKDAEATELQKLCDCLCHEVLKQKAGPGDRFAPSSFNFLRLIYGTSAGAHGASPQKIAKLFSAARYWGTGARGWQKWDRTWLCVDQRGKAVQGRVVWSTPAC